MSKKKPPERKLVVIKLDTDEKIVLAIMNLQVCLQNLFTTGDPKAAIPALQESQMAIDPLATQILNKMVNQKTPGTIIEDAKEVIIDFQKRLKKEKEKEKEKEGNSDTPLT